LNRSLSHRLLAALVLLVGLGACETAIEPFEQDQDRRYALHGLLDSAADTQYVRVQVLRDALNGPEATLGADVVMHSHGDEERVWEYVQGRDELGAPTHLFRSAFRPRPGVRYALVLEQSGQSAASAAVTQPPLPDVEVQPAVGELSPTKRVIFRGVDPQLNAVSFWYVVDDPVTGKAVRIDRPYPLPGTWENEGWAFTIFLAIDRSDILRVLGLDPDDRSVRLLAAGAHVEIRSPEWTSREPDPGIVTGHGFFASVGRYDIPWILPGDEVRRMGFVDAQGD